MRRGAFSIAAIALLGACSSGSDGTEAAVAEKGADAIACAVGGKSEFANVCFVERNQAEGTLFLTVRHPDGAFRRFKVLTDGRGIEPADGAEPAEALMDGEMLQVAIGQDRYRFPVTKATHAAEP